MEGFSIFDVIKDGGTIQILKNNFLLEYAKSGGISEEKIHNYLIPKESYTYTIPEDINKTLESLIPNFNYILHYRGIDKYHKEEILQEFFIHFLSPGENGIVRYKIYDSITYPNLPYFKFVLNKFKYFILYYLTNLKCGKSSKIQNNSSSLYKNINKDNSESFTIFDRVSVNNFNGVSESVEESLIMKELYEYIEFLHSKDVGYGSFSKYVPLIFNSIVHDISINEISKINNLPETNLYVHKRKLSKLIKSFIIEGIKLEA